MTPDGSIAVVSTAVQVPVLSSGVTFSGIVGLFSFSSPSGQSQSVLMSTNVAVPLANWTHLSTGAFGIAPVNFTDSAATNAHRVYRIVSPQRRADTRLKG